MTVEVVAAPTPVVEVTLPTTYVEVAVSGDPVVIERVYSEPIAATKQVFVQQSQPVMVEPSMWWETASDGSLVTLWVEDGQ